MPRAAISVLRRASVGNGTFRCFWSGGNAYGRVTIGDGVLTLDVLGGDLFSGARRPAGRRTGESRQGQRHAPRHAGRSDRSRSGA